MANPQPTIQPPLSGVYVQPSTSSGNSWIRAMLSGVSTPGTIGRDGMKGFKRKTGWDVKAGKGTAGATLTLKDAPPVEGIVTVQLFTDQDFSDWDSFVSAVLAIPVTDQQADGLAWYYAGHQSIGLTAVVVKYYEGPIHVGRGMYHGVFELLEWSPPPAASIVKTVAATLPDGGSGTSYVKQPDPRIIQANAELQAAVAQRYDGGGGGSSF